MSDADALQEMYERLYAMLVELIESEDDRQRVLALVRQMLEKAAT